ncbi:thermonuclease family protein [Sphingomonas koreensis]|uniref:thermonuclease family protein n=1 Tax=Sphingomonas koreensis TaxID=93064 RepID=UPI001F498142|nr:thermonuclease family protein [Sphingomonas koreensis]
MTRAALILTALAGIAGGLGWAAYPLVPGEARAVADRSAGLSGRPVPIARFTLCHSGGGSNCVVDGDTFRMNGAKIRIADIDTPETHPARCAREAELGAAATRRLHALLNSGTVSLETVGRDADRYGRKLRLVSVDDRGVGETLVAEGLARPYSGGYRAGWCD